MELIQQRMVTVYVTSKIDPSICARLELRILFYWTHHGINVHLATWGGAFNLFHVKCAAVAHVCQGGMDEFVVNFNLVLRFALGVSDNLAFGLKCGFVGRRKRQFDLVSGVRAKA